MIQVNGQAPISPTTSPRSPLDIALDVYEETLITLEQESLRPTFEQKVAVLAARDGVEKKKQMDQNPTSISYARLLSLDERLKAQAKILSEDDELAQWKDSLNAAPNMWWWHLKYPLVMSSTKVAKRYQESISLLEAALPYPTQEQVLEVLLARDAIETSRDNQPLPEHIAKIVIDLDERLRSLADVINRDGKLEYWKKSLSKITPNTWWWELSDIEPIPTQAVERYEKALFALESPPKPSSEELLEVLLARDAVEKAWTKQQQPPRHLTAKIIELDKRLKAQSQAFANDDIVDEWKNNLKPPEMNWWWSFTRSIPLPNEAIARYEKTIQVIDNSKPPSSEQLLDTLLARDGVEEAVEGAYRDKPVPEKLARQIIALDNKLKQYRLDLNKDNQIRQWKDSLKRQNRWWWELKPAIVGSEEEPGTRKDWLFNTLAVVCLGVGAAFTAYSSQVFFQKVEGQEVQQADLSQNMAAVLQVIGLGAGGAAALTSGGRKTLEKLFTNLQLPPSKQAPTALAIAAGMTAITGTLAASLPLWGKVYISQGEAHLQNTNWLKAQDSFLQAKKFISGDEDKAEVEIGLGMSYEHLGDLAKAKDYYKQAAYLDNIEGMTRYARLSLVDFFLKNPPNSRVQPSVTDENLRQAHLFNQRAWIRITKWLDKNQQTPEKIDRNLLNLTQLARTNGSIISAVQDLIVSPKDNKALQDEEYRQKYWTESVAGLFKSNLDELKNLKVADNDALNVRAICFTYITGEQLRYTENITNVPPELFSLVHGYMEQDPNAPNCYDDKALSIYDFSLIEALAKMYKKPKYRNVLADNYQQQITNAETTNSNQNPQGFNPQSGYENQNSQDSQLTAPSINP
ncbi:tetratricopeptide TPR_2 [Calothrix sp. NIES-4101]|nr:tetratricopeptide TPR_2 [Calothrix sp. NIES-4101]